MAPRCLISRIIALPAELRCEIYYYAILNHFKSWRPPGSEVSTEGNYLTKSPLICKRSQLYPPLLKSNPFILADAIPTLLTKFTFNFASLYTLQQVPPKDRAFIKRCDFRLGVRPSDVNFVRLIKSIRQFVQLLPSLEATMLHFLVHGSLENQITYQFIRDGLLEGLQTLMSTSKLQGGQTVWIGCKGSEGQAQKMADWLEWELHPKIVIAKASALGCEEDGNYRI